LKAIDVLKQIALALQQLTMPDRLWSIEDLQTYFNVRSTVAYRIKDQPNFPKPIRLLDNSQPRWRPQDIKDWAESRREKNSV
jgi:predicted DNA-binding transcriptional regulator AlpA